MSLQTKISKARAFIAELLTQYQRPAVLFSSGKDSLVLLHLVRAVAGDRVSGLGSGGAAPSAIRHPLDPIPVVFHREPWQPKRYEFADQLIRDWNLTVFDWPPEKTILAHANDHFSIFNLYQLAPGKHTALPIDCYELGSWVSDLGSGEATPSAIRPQTPDAKPQTPLLCGLDVFHRPKAQFTAPWDLYFHGHKSSDVDPLLGPIPLTVDIKRNDGCGDAAFVLRDWTDADVWEYITTQRVPWQTTRYELRPDGTRGESADKTLNPDYLAACTRCLDRRNPARVYCPKLRAYVNNVSGSLPTEDLQRPAFIAPATK